MEFHRSASKHGISQESARHALDHALVVVDLEPDADPPRLLAVGPDLSGNLVEVIWLELAVERRMVIHAMALRPSFYELLPPGEDEL